jgi:hypothetical protein
MIKRDIEERVLKFALDLVKTETQQILVRAEWERLNKIFTLPIDKNSLIASMLRCLSNIIEEE